jgi:hypothetical protein
MAMSKRAFRTKQAIEAFESCAGCASLPADKKSEVAAELSRARARKDQQDAEVRRLLLLLRFGSFHLFMGLFLFFSSSAVVFFP